jgi:hypothetical protein
MEVIERRPQVDQALNIWKRKKRKTKPYGLKAKVYARVSAFLRSRHNSL